MATEIPGWLIMALIVLIILAVIMLLVFGRQIMYMMCRWFVHFMPLPLTKIFGPGYGVCGWLI